MTSQHIPITDLGKEYTQLRGEIDPALQRILSSGSYILGSETQAFEKELAAYGQSRHAIGVNSGTDAILLALRALDVGPGDEVIVPAMTFMGTAEPVAQLGAKPVFADIDPVSYTLDPAKAAKKINSRTKAIIAVHLYGQSADLNELGRIAAKAKVPLIEDMAQAIGSEYEGKKIGSFGAISCLSFFPTKNLGACGDGGALLTSSDDLADRLRALRNHGARIKYQHDEVGYNTRLDEIQSAILRIKLKHLDAWNDRRRQLARLYEKALEGIPIQRPKEIAGRKHIFHLYSIQSKRRDALKKHLESRGISTGLHYPAPLHLQPAFASLGDKRGDYPASETLAANTLSLPLYPHMSDEDVAYVSQAVREFFGTQAAS